MTDEPITEIFMIKEQWDNGQWSLRYAGPGGVTGFYRSHKAARLQRWRHRTQILKGTIVWEIVEDLPKAI